MAGLSQYETGLRTFMGSLKAYLATHPSLAAAIDGLGYHPYASLIQGTGNTSGIDTNLYLFSSLTPVELKSKPLYITELGFTTNPRDPGFVPTEEEKAKLIPLAYNLLRTLGVKDSPIFYYDLTNDQTSDRYSLEYPDKVIVNGAIPRNRNPAFEAFRNTFP